MRRSTDPNGINRLAGIGIPFEQASEFSQREWRAGNSTSLNTHEE
jgi:hypothetical protein